MARLSTSKQIKPNFKLKMSKEFIMQMRPFFGEEEKKALAEYMEEDGFLTEFKRTEVFEEMIADFTSSKHCIVVNNGTISLTLAAIALEIKPGDEVIVPNYTMIATPNSVKMIGAKPIFVDVEEESLCLDINKVTESITSKTKAIILVSSNGRYPKTRIKEFTQLAKKHKISLIEDAAQSLGSFYPNGKHIGTVGDIGSFSFSAPKIISTGQGGALITNNDKLAKRLRKLKDFGRTSGGNDIHDEIGFNFKFTELQACIGIEQMKKLNARIIRKKEIWSKYSEQLDDIEEVKLFDHDLKCTSPWFIDSIVEKREQLMAFLKRNNIGSRIMYPPINKQKAYNIEGPFSVSSMIGKKGLWFPSSIQLSDEQIIHICKIIRKFYKK